MRKIVVYSRPPKPIQSSGEGHRQKLARQQLICARPLLEVELEGQVEELDCLLADMFGGRWAGLVAADGENGLQLTAVREGMGADEHLDD